MAGERTGAQAGERLQWVDAAKGVGILLVIAGHVWWQAGAVHHVIYAFHMPLFFLLSGYMVKPQPSEALLARQLRSLGLPFLAFSLILIATDMVVETAQGHRPIFGDLWQGLMTIALHSDRLRGPFTILWFIPCLILARILWNFVALRWPDPFGRPWLALVIAIMVAGHWASGRINGSPLGIKALPAAFTCYWIGQMWRRRPPAMATSLFLLAPIAVMTLLYLPPVNLKPGDFGLPLLSLAGAAAISILLCKIILVIPDRTVRPLAWLGRISLVIMYVHVAFIHYLSPWFGKPMLFVIALTGSIFIHFAAASNRAGRTVLLGER